MVWAFFLRMNTFRNRLKDNYTTIPNEFVNDSRMSWKAKGIFLYLASKPDDWRFHMDQISTVATDQLGSLKSGIKELETLGYLVRDRIFDDAGKIAGWRWTLNLPSKNHQTENPPDGKTTGRKTVRYTNTDNTNTELTKTDNTKYSLREKTEWFIDLWNRTYETEVRFTPKKQSQVQQRLKTFEANEIVKAIKNRKEDPWMNGKGYKFRTNWDSFWRNDEKVEHYLTSQSPRSISTDSDLPF